MQPLDSFTQAVHNEPWLLLETREVAREVHQRDQHNECLGSHLQKCLYDFVCCMFVEMRNDYQLGYCLHHKPLPLQMHLECLKAIPSRYFRAVQHLQLHHQGINIQRQHHG